MTLDELNSSSTDINERLNQLRGYFDIPGNLDSKKEFERAMSAMSFWDNKETAQKTVQQLSRCKTILDPFLKLESRIDDFSVILELIAEDEDDTALFKEADDALPGLLKSLDQLELISFLDEKYDSNNCFLSLQAGAGGTESQDWCDMLFRMYTRWLEQRGFQAQILDIQEGEGAGLKSASIHVIGDNAYGYMKSEHGVHRLVRISPFDSNKRRHTSFAAVELAPEISDDIEIEIDEKDLEISTFRASGAGGQHVNTTDSAVRIKHKPTGFVVSCQNERSQHQNKHTAMKVLKSKIFELEQQKINDEKEAASGPKEDNAWGSQIRSYVLHPYQMVKDLRTQAETSNTSDVLDGDLDMFIEAYLKMKH
ncbi:MAG: peptide chain release factor 2 [Lentisphaeria bacterium]|nr:peptide chain release factor 2 [Lentisphaeria bacterium]